MKLLVLGKNGQLASELMRIAADAVYIGREQADLTKPATLERAFHGIQPNAVINAAAYTAVDKAETERVMAYALNALAPGMIASLCAKNSVPLVHISTDYVFGGKGDQPFTPEQQIAPLGVYGDSKALGELMIRNAAPPHAILRTSWVFSAHGTNFVKTMLRLSQTREHLNIVSDQYGGPTSARALAKACLKVAYALCQDLSLSGTYHYSGMPSVSWADFARDIFVMAGRQVEVNEVLTKDYPTPAQRPLNSRLDCEKTLARFCLEQPGWRADLKVVLKELGYFV